MPILDPSLQFSLIRSAENKYCDFRKYFFLKYLRIASKNLYRSLDTIESSIQFKKDIKNSINFINWYFECNINENTFFNPSIKDYYKYLYDHINSKFKRKRPNDHGLYIKLQNSVINNSIDFYIPNIDYPRHHSWVLTDSPIAILILKANKEITDIYQEIIQLINLEIDLMSASGFALVLCVFWHTANQCDSKILMDTISTHKFSEIHFNIIYAKKSQTQQYESILSNILDMYDNFHGYFYMYSPISKMISSTSSQILSQLKKKPRFTNFSFSRKLTYVFNSYYKNESIPFIYCENGFDYEKIRILLNNVPLYKTKDSNSDFIPIQTSEISVGYINKEDFLKWSKNRIKILFDDQNNNHCHTYKYINFDDIHLSKVDDYLNNIIYTANTNSNNLETVSQISDDCQDKSEDEFKKTTIFSLFKEKKLIKGLTYVLSAYQYNFRKHVNDNFKFHDNQILTALEACKNCLNIESKEIKNQGIIYQIDTGEGKSCIICLIAALLALMKKNVHITSSNINLSNRDYYESYSFFQTLGLSSAVLLHYNELPYVSLNNESNDDTLYDKKFFPDIYFGENLFRNSSNMNFSVCGIDANNNITKNKAKIVFSTFVNFECLYLRMMEMCPAYINDYFKKHSLLIDEADSILIDELTNGTILSRTIKTNGNDILKYVYKCRMNKKKPEKVLKKIVDKWPKCKNMAIDDVIGMFEDIDLVNQDEFVNGKKYSIETTEIKDENKKNRIVKQIVPFDYQNKGILEPNKEFNGFIQQFIAIKEMTNNKNNKNMIIKDLSMNYLFISHPIFIKLYDGVCGVTGTIGNKYDKRILKEQYNLSTMKIPRNKPNHRVDFPVVLCSEINERNYKIVSEIIEFNKKEVPVLAIFKDLIEIQDVFIMLISKGIKNINIFDGKDEKIKPDRISGIKGAISLGTNFCGRGTDIKEPVKPLHVIITYYTSNTRVLQQAYGRTARQGQKGSVQIICLKNEYLEPVRTFKENDMKNILDEYDLKNMLQIEYIDKFKKSRDWIFSGDICSQKLSTKDIEKLRDAKININRINAFNFEYPLCMSIPTFLDIQSQKIFSLYNCPNCKYTWMLFQKYIREMILESWSIFIDQTQRKYFRLKIQTPFIEYLNTEQKSLFDLLEIYLPESSNSDNEIYKIVPTFMNIFNIVIKKYESKVLNSYPNSLRNLYNQFGKKQFCSFYFGFKPFSLLDKSGSRINTLQGDDDKKINYIKDPELKYIQKQPNNRFTILSITEKIDGVFDLICQKINDVIGSYIGLSFFLRRTLGGCEFGVCYDFDLENVDENLFSNPNTLFDKDPLLMFTISVKSMVPILAGILIIGLVYIASVAKSISEWILAFPEKISKELIKKTVKEVASLILSSQIEKFCDSICGFLSDKLVNQIENMKKYSEIQAQLFSLLLKLVGKKDFENSGNFIGSLFEEKIFFKMKTGFGDFLSNANINYSGLLKIGFLIMLNFAAFMMNFHHQKSIKYDSKKVSADYDKNQNAEKSLQKNNKVISVDKMNVSNSTFDLKENEED